MAERQADRVGRVDRCALVLALQTTGGTARDRVDRQEFRVALRHHPEPAQADDIAARGLCLCHASQRHCGGGHEHLLIGVLHDSSYSSSSFSLNSLQARIIRLTDGMLFQT
ncbi:hypothetical protein D3C71_1805870 [compost metagenome]